MHRELDEAQRDDARILDVDRRLAEARAALEQDQRLFDREIPYTIQPAERLKGLIDQVRAAFE
jgi:hypothetical protein